MPGDQGWENATHREPLLYGYPTPGWLIELTAAFFPAHKYRRAQEPIATSRARARLVCDQEGRERSPREQGALSVLRALRISRSLRSVTAQMESTRGLESWMALYRKVRSSFSQKMSWSGLTGHLHLAPLLTRNSLNTTWHHDVVKPIHYTHCTAH